MNATIRFEDWLKERMTDPEFRAEWEATAPGYQVAALRIRRGLTQAQLAELVGTTQSSIARLESGRAEPRLSFLRRVVDALSGQLTIQIADSKDREPHKEIAPTVRATATSETVAWPFSGLTWPLAYPRPGTSLRSGAIDREYCLPDELRDFAYMCISRANAEAKTTVLQ